VRRPPGHVKAGATHHSDGMSARRYPHPRRSAGRSTGGAPEGIEGFGQRVRAYFFDGPAFFVCVSCNPRVTRAGRTNRISARASATPTASPIQRPDSATPELAARTPVGARGSPRRACVRTDPTRAQVSPAAAWQKASTRQWHAEHLYTLQLRFDGCHGGTSSAGYHHKTQQRPRDTAEEAPI
jgi:hypothetical protein